jgi:hypothetical protein
MSRSITVESRVSSDPLRVGQHRAEVVPHDFVEHLRLERCHRALGLRIPVAICLHVLDAVVVAEHEPVLAPRLSPRADHRIAASSATQHASEQQVVVVVRASQRKAFVVREALLDGQEEITVEQGRS